MDEHTTLAGTIARAAAEAVLEYGRDGARLRPADDAFLLSRIGRHAAEAVRREFDVTSRARIRP